MRLRYVVKKKMLIKQFDWHWDVIDKRRGRGLLSIMCSCADRADADEIAIVLNQKEVAGNIRVL